MSILKKLFKMDKHTQISCHDAKDRVLQASGLRITCPEDDEIDDFKTEEDSSTDSI